MDPDFPLIRELLGRAAMESLHLAAQGAPAYLRYGIVIHYTQDASPLLLPPEMLAERRRTRVIQAAFCACVDAAYEGWATCGIPAGKRSPHEEPEWLRLSLDTVLAVLQHALAPVEA